MKTPQEKYLHDPQYRFLVDTLESYIHRASFTPSELREAAIFACINYEMNRKLGLPKIIPEEVDNALNLVHEFLKQQP